jgi:hypothetical protein
MRRPICVVIERSLNTTCQTLAPFRKEYTLRTFARRTKAWITNENRFWKIELEGLQPRTAIQFHFGKDETWSQGCFILGSFLQPTDSAGIIDRYCKVQKWTGSCSSLARDREWDWPSPKKHDDRRGG